MKRVLITVFIILNATMAFAGKNDFTIKGIITNPLADKIIFSYYTYNDNWLDEQMHEVTETLADDGSFNVIFPLSHQYTLIRISNGAEATEIFANPGDALKLTVDATDFDATLKYSGNSKSAVVANFMAKNILINGASWSFYDEKRELQLLEPNEYINSLDTLIDNKIDFLISNSKGLPESFIEFWDALYEYHKFGGLLEYPYMHEVVLNDDKLPNEIPAESYTTVQQVPEKFDDRYLNLMPYRNAIYIFYSQQLRADGIVSDKSVPGKEYLLGDKMLELSRKHMPLKSAEYVYARYILNNLKNVPIERTEWLFEMFTRRYTNSSYTKYLYDKIEQKKKLSSGSPAIDFQVSDANGKKIKLSDLKGKVLYIDFWASWCSPCRAQFPYAAKVKEHFEGKDVVFIYVSIDEDAKSWKDAIDKYNLNGLHTRVGEQSQIVDDYGAKGVPTYFIVDKEGNFWGENPPRPSSTEALIKIIESLL